MERVTGKKKEEQELATNCIHIRHDRFFEIHLSPFALSQKEKRKDCSLNRGRLLENVRISRGWIETFDRDRPSSRSQQGVAKAGRKGWRRREIRIYSQLNNGSHS